MAKAAVLVILLFVVAAFRGQASQQQHDFVTLPPAVANEAPLRLLGEIVLDTLQYNESRVRVRVVVESDLNVDLVYCNSHRNLEGLSRAHRNTSEDTVGFYFDLPLTGRILDTILLKKPILCSIYADRRLRHFGLAIDEGVSVYADVDREFTARMRHIYEHTPHLLWMAIAVTLSTLGILTVVPFCVFTRSKTHSSSSSSSGGGGNGRYDKLPEEA
jgi:hypothetical protein